MTVRAKLCCHVQRTFDTCTPTVVIHACTRLSLTSSLPLLDYLKAYVIYIRDDRKELNSNKYRVIQNDCRGFNNLSYTIPLR